MMMKTRTPKRIHKGSRIPGSFIHFCIQSIFTPFDHSSMQEGDDEPMSYVHLG